MIDIAGNILNLKSKLPSNVTLVAVSKTKPVSEILKAYNSGQRIFGENRVQELLGKRDLLPADIEWHLIGHLQTNKAKYLVPFVSMIESVDSLKLLKTINSEAAKISRIVRCLLQIHIASEETKFGFSPEELIKILDSGETNDLKYVKICGLMGMATFTSDTVKVRNEFMYLSGCFKLIKKKYFFADPLFCDISMGMSGDYAIAIEEGSTMVRLGSIIFGERK
jgi:PLP dependent protein